MKPPVVYVESLVISARVNSGYESLNLGHHTQPFIGLCGNDCLKDCFFRVLCAGHCDGATLAANCGAYGFRRKTSTDSAQELRTLFGGGS